MANTMLYFGSFNPIHKGHMNIVKYVLAKGLCDKVLIVVSPQSPFKRSDELAPENDRLKMVQLAIQEEELCGRVEASGIEFELPKPSYTAKTLRELCVKYPDDKFSILMGGDNIIDIDKWREWEWIVSNFEIYVYPRSMQSISVPFANVHMLENVPILPMNATEIRDDINSSDASHKWLHNSVYKYIKDHQIWMLNNN